MNATERLNDLIVARSTRLCVGLDPDLGKLPSVIRKSGDSAEQTYNFLLGVVGSTADLVCAYKPQKAFFDLLPGGHEVLKTIINHIHSYHPRIPVIIDCKVGDIDNTMAAYAANIFGKLGADGIIVNPYMGDDVFTPLREYADKAIVVLVKTSNPGATVIQDALLRSGRTLWQYVLEQVVDRWNQNNNLIPVLSATAGLDFASVRRQIPDQMPILLAGGGVQGGSFADLPKLLNSSGHGVFVNSSRGILYPPDLDDGDWKAAIRAAAQRFKAELA